MSAYIPKLLILAFLTYCLPLSSHADDEDSASPALAREQCLIELDSAVSLLSNETRRNMAAVAAAGSIAATIDKIVLDSSLADLEKRCPDLPQLAHNRGVLAASAERWPEAVTHLQRSLTQDKRAADTYQLLQKIYEHLAALAYSRALETPIEVSAPALNWQDSSDQNIDLNPPKALLEELQSTSTLEYELSAWWQALSHPDDLEEFYVDDFPRGSITESRKNFATGQWEEIQRNISFTARDAVVILSDARENRTLLLLRLVGTRWKIYQETHL